MTARRTLSQLVSYRRLGDRAALVDHASGDVHLLNAEGGDVIARLDAGADDFSEDEAAFVDELEELGILCSGSDRPDRPDASDASDLPADPDPLDELNAWAADALVPLYCQIELTYRCALRCQHCYLGHAGSDPREELTTGEIVAALAALEELGCLFLLLTGGEPFLRPDLEEIFSAARDRRFAVSFITSGWRHDPALLGRLARRGIDAAQVSLYGPTAAVHDAMTGATGSFDDAMACLRTLRDLGVRVRAAVTPTRLSIGGIEDLRALLEREGIPAALGLYLSPRRDGATSPQALAVDAEGLERALCAFPPAASPRMAGRGPDDRPCSAGANALSVDPYGAVHPCLQLRIPAGSIREEPLGAIWSDSVALRRIREIRVKHLIDCPQCALRRWCNRCAGFANAEGMPVIDHCSFDCLQARVVKELCSLPERER
jgi:radical SAM protein with 4Fe4S-binding SPASM domain